MKRLLFTLCAGAFVCGLSLTAHAGKASDKEPAKEQAKPKAKAGEACKTNDDCNQDSPQSCVDNKCKARPMPHPVT